MNGVSNKPYVLLVDTPSSDGRALPPEAIQQRSWELLRIPDMEKALEIIQCNEVVVVVVDCGNDKEDWRLFLSRLKIHDVMVIRLVPKPGNVEDQGSLVQLHQVLTAHCDPDELIAAIERSFKTWVWLQANPMLDTLLAQLRYLPSLPSLYFALQDEINAPCSNIRRIAKLLVRDAPLVARVLRIANSGFYARPREITDIHEAVSLLGHDLLLGIVLSAHLIDTLPLPGLKPEVLWKHNFTVARVAGKIARMNGCSADLIQSAGLAGLLHDIGTLVLLANLPDSYPTLLRKAGTDEKQLIELERQRWGGGHSDIGAMVLNLWNLADPVVEAVALHHDLDGVTFHQANPVTQAVFAAESLVRGYRIYGRDALANFEAELPFLNAPDLYDACAPLVSVGR